MLPIITDAWAHEFNQAAHMTCVHAIYGSHHLQQEIAYTGGGQDRNKNQNTLKLDDLVPFHVGVSQIKKEYHFIPFDNKSALQNCLQLSSGFIEMKSPPPKFT